jgi:uncharacterized protein (TIGR02996 family)
MFPDAFLQDICENPEDDIPRLVHADWLEDQGDVGSLARAEFIRVQIELARLLEEDPGRVRLLRREAELLDRHGDAWRAALPAFPGVTWDEFRRGFVESVRVASGTALSKSAIALFRAAPVRAVRFQSLTLSEARRLFEARFLERLTEVHLGNREVDPDGALVLTRSPHLANLRVLLLHNVALGFHGCALLATWSSHLKQLRELYLSGSSVVDHGLFELARSPHFPCLTDLDLRDNQVSDYGLAALANSPHYPQLTTVYLVNNDIGSIGAQMLAESPNFPHLRRLYLNHNPIGDRGARALAHAAQRSNLTELDLRHCEIGDAGAAALANSPYLHALQLLYLTGNAIGSRTATELRKRFGSCVRV